MRLCLFLNERAWVTRSDAQRGQGGGSVSSKACGCVVRAREAWRAERPGAAAKTTQGTASLKRIVAGSMSLLSCACTFGCRLLLPVCSTTLCSRYMPWLSSRLSDRTGRLHGAVVVRTPDDALKDTNVRVDFEPQAVRDAPKPRRSVPASSSAPNTTVQCPPVPPDPALTPLSAPVPSFSPILVSPPPGSASHLSSAIVILETCTTTYKSTLTTLCSQPSFLADYLISLAKPRISTGSSVYSSESTDLDGNCPVSQGPLGSTSSFHIFLDRSSSP